MWCGSRFFGEKQPSDGPFLGRARLPRQVTKSSQVKVMILTFLFNKQKSSQVVDFKKSFFEQKVKSFT